MAQVLVPSLTLCDDAQNYPQNVSDPTLTPYALHAIRHQLDSQEPRLFTDETQAAIDFLDLGNNAKGSF